MCRSVKSECFTFKCPLLSLRAFSDILKKPHVNSKDTGNEIKWGLGTCKKSQTFTSILKKFNKHSDVWKIFVKFKTSVFTEQWKGINDVTQFDWKVNLSEYMAFAFLMICTSLRCLEWSGQKNSLNMHLWIKLFSIPVNVIKNFIFLVWFSTQRNSYQMLSEYHDCMWTTNYKFIKDSVLHFPLKLLCTSIPRSSMNSDECSLVEFSITFVFQSDTQ